MSEECVLTIPQRFDFSFHKEFTAQYQKVIGDSQFKTIVMDFSRTEYLDSSALGMMVLLNKKAKANSQHVIVRHARENTLEILNIANFDKLFKFE